MNLGNREKKGKGLQDQSLQNPQPEQLRHRRQTDCQKEAGSGEDLFALQLCHVRCQVTGGALPQPASARGARQPDASWPEKRGRQQPVMLARGGDVSRCFLPQGTHTMPSKPCRPHFLPATWQPKLSASCMLFPGGGDEQPDQPGLLGRGRPRPWACCWGTHPGTG